MPRRDGTGPMGSGSMTGRGLGLCIGANVIKTAIDFGLGLGFRRGRGQGVGRFFNVNQSDPKTKKELLQKQKEILQSRIEVIDKQMGNL